jgi:hypothetical protein
MSRQLRPSPKDRIQERFEVFHEKNPHVYVKLVELARQVKASGLNTYGIEGLFARLRWYYSFETTGDPFKLNNSYRSRYVRLIMDTESDLKGFFHTRTLIAGHRSQQRAA